MTPRGLLLVLLAASTSCTPSEYREARGLADWFGWGSEPTKAPERRIIGPQTLQRRTSQVSNDEDYSRQTQARILVNRQKQRQKLSKPRPSQVAKRKVMMPVIISSYASTKVQGHGNEEEELENTIDEAKTVKDAKNRAKEDTFRANQEKASSPKPTKDKKGEEAEVLTISTSTTTKESSTTTTTTPSTTTTSTRTTTTEEALKEVKEEVVAEVVEDQTEAEETNEVADYDSQSPYLPKLPEILDDDRILVLGEEAGRAQDRSSESSDTYLAGYQQIQANKKVRFPGDSTTEEAREDRPAPPRQTKPDFYPLGKAPKGSPKNHVPRPIKPLVKPKPSQPKPAKEAEASSSFFDFLPFWKSGQAESAPAPAAIRPPARRPLPPGRRGGPTVTQLEQAPPPADYPAGLKAPLLLKVGSSNYPQQETPTRPLTREPKPSAARIDNRIYTEGEDPFVVLPAAPPKALPPRRAPPQQRRPLAQPAASRPLPPQRPPHPPRRGSGPLPMTSQPVIGLPQVPPSRKQSPFISKRPQLPPRVPGPFGPSKPFLRPPGPNRKPIKPPQKQFQKKVATRKPLIKATLPPTKPINPRPLPSEISLKPNGSNRPISAMADHLSSLLTSFLSTTVSPARPLASLPSLVEDTEFADVVNGYKPSDATETTKQEETTTKKTTTTANSLTKSDYDDDLDSLSAPLPRSALVTNNQLPTRETTVSTTTRETTTTTTKAPTTTTTKSTTTTTSTSTTTAVTYPPPTFPTSTFIAPIQEIVDDYRSKVHVVPQDQLDSSVYQTLQKDFEQKRNIFEQFVSGGNGAVTFTEIDKRFTPHKEVYNSDWSVQTNSGPPSDLPSVLALGDKVLVYQDLSSTALTPVATAPAKVAAPASAAARSSPTTTRAPPARTKQEFFPNERNAEGGFKPIVSIERVPLN